MSTIPRYSIGKSNQYIDCRTLLEIIASESMIKPVHRNKSIV